MRIAVVLGSIRQGRVSERLAKWVLETAKSEAPDVDWYLVDLADYNLPMFDEANPPMAGKRSELSDGTKQYLQAMDEADGFIIVTPEYNHGMPSALKNAIDLLDFQLMKKPVAIVSQGVVGGARANEQVRLVINSNLGAVPVPNSLPFYGNAGQMIDENGKLLVDSQPNTKALSGVITNLLWYARALKQARETDN